MMSKATKRDVETLLIDLKKGEGNRTVKSLERLYNRLANHPADNEIFKSNHTIMELICAKSLIKEGYRVEVEHPLPKRLKPMSENIKCDIYATKRVSGIGINRVIVEVETGFVAPKDALDPESYLESRLASKIARYSIYADKFILGTPSYYNMKLPKLFLKPPRMRIEEEVNEIVELCGPYYNAPPVSEYEVRNARLHMINMINVGGRVVTEIDPTSYMEKVDELTVF